MRKILDSQDPMQVDLSEAPGALALARQIIEDIATPAVLIVGEERRLFYNVAYAPILGLDRQGAQGRRVLDIWEEAADQVSSLLDQVFSGRSLRVDNHRLILNRPDPEEAIFDYTYTPVREADGTVVAALCLCNEITNEVRARERQTFLGALDEIFRSFEDAGDIIAEAQARLGQHFGVSRVGYGMMDPSECFFTTQSNWTNGSVPHHNGVHDLRAFGPAIYSDLRTGVPLAIDDVRFDRKVQDANAIAAFDALEVRSAATVSLVKGGRFVAALYLHHHKPRRWSRTDLELIQEVAERTWSAAERAHAQENLRVIARRQSFLLRLGDELRPLSDAKQIKAAAASMLGRELGVSRVGYGEIDESGLLVTVEEDWTNGSTVSLAGETRPLAIFGPAIIDQLRQGRPLKLDSIVDDPISAAYAAGYASIDARSLVVIPLIKARRLTAILYLHEPDPRVWTTHDVSLASEVAERTWAVVERARAEAAANVLHDTLEHRVEEALAERALFAGMVEDTDAPIQMIDTEYRFVAINPAAQDHYARVFGTRPQVGDSLREALVQSSSPEGEAGALLAWRRALDGESFDELGWWGGGECERRAYEMRFRPYFDNAGKISGAYLIGRDVTDLLLEQERSAAAEEQLRQGQKMEAMGQLTGGVAHDFNNLLTPIVAALDLLERRGVGGDREKRLINGAAQAADRAKVLVQRLLAFARRQPLQATAVSLTELLNGMADLIGSTVGPHIKVVAEVAEADLAAKADRNQLEMALLNLAVNARDAMTNGGILRLAARRATKDEVDLGLIPGDFIVLSVADTGCGMDAATLKRAVEPFFSTKGIGKGTGLGLSMAHGLASQLGGSMNIRSELGVGTEIELWLPATIISSEVHPASATPPSAGSGLALVVDDEPLVRSSTADMLQDLGFSIAEAASAEEALALINGGLSPDVVVTDHLMSGASGAELARQVRALRPSTQVLIVSGYAGVDEIAPDLRRLNKPFRRDELAEALNL